MECQWLSDSERELRSNGHLVTMTSAELPMFEMMVGSVCLISTIYIIHQIQRCQENKRFSELESVDDAEFEIV